ncbi:MAG: preprotein translocase subunit SecG [Clostridia bacterium]|nr:preprotein translocase subunit SecG [Clostridia bacterium]
MEVVITILCTLMILMAIFLVVAVLMQSGKDSHLSGTIAGGAETFFGKTKGKTIDRVLSKATTIVSIIFVVFVLLVYVLQSVVSNNDLSGSGSSSNSGSSQNATVETQTAETAENETAETATAE